MREIGYYLALIQEFGRWRLGVRYDYYNPDQDSNKNAKGSPVPTDVSYSTLAVAAACVAPWGRLIVEYDRNQNHLGHQHVRHASQSGRQRLPGSRRGEFLMRRNQAVCWGSGLCALCRRLLASGRRIRPRG
jgi:hypothetical protein